MDKLIDDYLTAANVAVPLPNPNFDPAKFDASQIGVQAGGLKMPKGKKTPPDKSAATKPAKPVNTTAMLGWTAKGAGATVAQGSLRVKATGGQSLLINSKLRVNGPAEATLRVRTQKDGEVRMQWRTDGQDLFPKNEQIQTIAITGGDWQDVNVQLAAKAQIIHVRIVLPKQKQPVEIDWIEIKPTGETAKDAQRWDFGVK
jgi:hypothetical protein